MTYLFPWKDSNEIWTKKWVSLVLGKVYENCQKIKKRCYFTRLTSKIVILTRNHLFVQKIVMKYGLKKWVGLDFGKVYENYSKIKENCYFAKLTSKRVI